MGKQANNISHMRGELTDKEFILADVGDFSRVPGLDVLPFDRPNAKTGPSAEAPE